MAVVGKSVKRKEDPRLITGEAHYIEDIKLPSMTHAAVLRSPHAHAKYRQHQHRARSSRCRSRRRLHRSGFHGREPPALPPGRLAAWITI